MGAPACFSRATIFDADESTHMANLEWAYPLGHFSNWGGSINLLDNDNVLFTMSAYSGVSTDLSRSLEVTRTASPVVVWQMDVGSINAYRAYRIPSLYPDVTWTY